jgi:dTMP kinase
MTKQSKTGRLIALEGMDGCGKSVGKEYLKAAFEKAGLSAVATYEVGGTPIGKELRTLAFKKRDDESLDPLARLLLIYAARIQHIRQVLWPAISTGSYVITDRYNDTTRIYQGLLDNLDREMDQIEACAPMRLLAQRADYVVYFKVDTEVAYQRGRARKDVDNDTYKNDLEKADKINKHYDDYFKKIAQETPQAVFVVNANEDLASVHQQLDQFVAGIVAMHKLGIAESDD